MNELLPWLNEAPLARSIELALFVVAALYLFRVLHRRLLLSRAKHPSLRGHSRMARRVARLVPSWSFGEASFFAADGADDAIVARRRAGFEALASTFRNRSPSSIAMLERLAGSVSDLQFVGRYRVPFPFSRLVRERLKPGIVVQASAGVTITDLDGHPFIDLTGAYGVNVFGTDFYKACIDQACKRMRKTGPILGPYVPAVERNVERLKQISGLDEVSFHMSGTEAVMQAVRLARYHTGRSHIVRFCGAYHGWWDDVQPGIGNPSAPGKVYTLAEMSEATLKVLRKRRNIACVLVNPLQAMHPNANAPADGALVNGLRQAHFDRAAYTDWLRRLRRVCSEAGIVLILDEIFVGFRIAARGAQEYFGIQADLVTYGKTLGGGLPVGVLCGRAELMKRFREHHPLDICFARGTFNSHPYVMGAMQAFLEHHESAAGQQLYEGLDAHWDSRARRINEALTDAGLPLRVEHFSSIFTVTHAKPTRYGWMLQFYLNAEGLLLPWVGSGRLIFTIDFPDAEFDEVIQRLVRAGRAMQRDGWWDSESAAAPRLGRQMMKEMLAAWLGRPLQ